jgi:outer membrane protein OmpA-like peptidoglycan-associated protein
MMNERACGRILGATVQTPFSPIWSTMDFRRIVSSRAAAVFATLLLAACAAPPGGSPPPAPSPAPAPLRDSEPPPPAVAPAPAPALPPAPFAEAVARAGEKLLQDAQAIVGTGPRELVIDPLIDASTGQQTAGTVAMGAQMAALVKTKAPTWYVRPLTRSSLGNGPLLLIGTLTAVNTRNNAVESADAFRICLVLIDLRSGKLIAKRVDRSTVDSVNAEPTVLYRDSPTWSRDKTILAYIKSCQGSSPGDTIDPNYLLRLPAAALLNEANLAYGSGKFADAYRLYRDASLVAEPDDLRVLNGLYITSWRTGKKKEAGDAFGQIVSIGLDAKRLPIKMFFNPGATTLLQNADLQAQYALWMREVAAQVGGRETCMKVVGHTSKTGLAAANETLSQRRAAVIRQNLERQNKKLAPRLTSDGVGSRETLVGLGTDDIRDALDRRVEFRTVDCP